MATPNIYNVDPDVADLLVRIDNKRHYIPIILAFMELPHDISARYMTLISRGDWDTTKPVLQRHLIQILCNISALPDGSLNPPQHFVEKQSERTASANMVFAQQKPTEEALPSVGPRQSPGLLPCFRSTKTKLWRCPHRECKKHREPYCSEGYLIRHMRVDHGSNLPFYEENSPHQLFQSAAPSFGQSAPMAQASSLTYQPMQGFMVPSQDAGQLVQASAAYPFFPWSETKPSLMLDAKAAHLTLSPSQ